MRIVTAAAFAAAFVISTPAFAKENAQQSAERTEVGSAKFADTEKKVCRQLDATGTRKTEKVCLTKDDWKKVEDNR